VPRPRHRSHRLQTAILVGAAIVVVAIVAIVLAITAGSGGKKKHSSASSTSTAPAKPGELRLAIGTVTMENAGPPATIRPSVRRALLSASQRYVDDAILAPLKTGNVNDAYETIFDQGVRTNAAGVDRTILTEATTGVARGAVSAKASAVHLDGLGDQNGKPVLIAATFYLTIKVPLAKGPLSILRVTELTFASAFGKWYVTAYNVGVKRTIGATTTAKSASTTGDLEAFGATA
jgi:hypothetical protein